MAFTPENELEKTMLAAVTQDSARPLFYRAVLEAELIVLGEIGDKLSIDTVVNNGETFLPIFSAASRLDACGQSQRPHFRIRGRVLFEATRGAAFVLNLGSDVGKKMVPEEIAYCLDQARQAEWRGGLAVGQPKVYPKKLVQGLCVLFMSRSQVIAAHLAFVAREGLDEEPHPLIGIEAEGDVNRLVNEIFAVAAAAMPKVPVDVLDLDPRAPAHPLQKHLHSIAPFYRRPPDDNPN